MADKANGVQDALAQIMALPGFPFGGPMFASDLCDHDEDGEAVNDDWGYESRNLIASCVNFVCEHFAELAALEAKLEAAERDAARYRWLRDAHDYRHPSAGLWHVRDQQGNPIATGQLDAAIDAQRQEGKHG